MSCSIPFFLPLFDFIYIVYVDERCLFSFFLRSMMIFKVLLLWH